jgi:hypothetical protein
MSAHLAGGPDAAQALSESSPSLTSLPILGPILDGFGTWLLKQGYATDCLREPFCTARRVTRILEQPGIHSLAKLTRARLRACAPANRLDDHRLTATVHLLERYFVSETSLFPPRPRTRIEDRVASFAIYLEQVRGLASSSIEAHCKTTSALLAHIGYEQCPRRLGALTARDIEAFICRGGKGLGRRSVQHTTNRYATVDLEMKRKAIEQARPIDETAAGIALWRSDASILTWLEAL